ncbi:MAG: hypothetical protein RL528_2057 [Bacteroidota bacterium]
MTTKLFLVVEVTIQKELIKSYFYREILIFESSKSKLKHLDVSKNKALKYLNCSSNNLAELDLFHNLMLSKCDCSKNYLMIK